MIQTFRDRMLSGHAMPMRVLVWTLVLFVFLLSIQHGLITLSTILASRLDYPLHDEFRINLRYLDNPFPLNVFLLENGHRTIFPGLVRLVDLHQFGGRNLFQMTVAWCLAAIALGVWVRQARLSLTNAHAAASLAIVLAFVCWNAQTRMFIHAYETSHILYTFAGLMVALAGFIAAARNAWRVSWLALAVSGAAFAMFSFGPGVAVFAALFVMLWIRRAPLRTMVGMGAVFLCCLLLYTFLLPGAEGVRNSTRDFQFAAAPFLFFTRLGAPLHEILSPRWGRDDPLVVLACLLVGMVMFVLVARHAYRLWRNQIACNDWDLMVLGTFVFAAAANFVIVIGRSDYLMEHTTQLFADRYLFWGSLTWMAFWLQGLSWGQGGGRHINWRFAAVLLGIIVVLKSMLPIARGLSDWATAVRREVSLSAAAQFVGHRDDARLARIADAGVHVALAADARMRERRLGHYEHTPGARKDVPVTFQPRGDLPHLKLHKRQDGLIDTVLDKPHARPWRNRHLLVLDEEGRILASGMLTLAHQSAPNRWRLGRPTHNWFEAYWFNKDRQPVWLVGERDGIWQPVARLSWYD